MNALVFTQGRIAAGGSRGAQAAPRACLVVAALLSIPVPAPAVAAEDGPATIRVTGFVESAYAIASRSVDHRIVGNLYLPRHDTFALGAASLQVDRAAPTDRTGAGFVIQAMAGDHARVVRAAGLDLGEYADVVQAHAIFALGRGFRVSAGKMPTMLGNEVIDAPRNPNLSVGNQYVFLENFTDTGADLEWAGSGGWSARARLTNGWDVVVDNNQAKTVFGKLAWSRDSRGVALLGYSGAEFPDSVTGRRSGVELLANSAVGPLSATLQLDAGREPALDADWWGAGLWVLVPVRPDLDLALRGDVIDDSDGARTSGALGFPAHDGQRLVSMTVTARIRAIPGALIRPEVRYDRSDLPVFRGQEDQWTCALGAALIW